MGWEIISPVVIVLWALTLVGLERRFPYDRGQRLFRRGFLTDLVVYGLVQSYVLGLAIAGIVRASSAIPGVSELRLVAGWPAWAQLLLFTVLHDLYIYWFHRLQHRVPFLWRFHEAHHSVHDLDWVAGSRSHPVEILINQTVEFAPMVLLGASPDVVLAKGALDAVWGMWIHSNVGARTGPLQLIVNGPEMHRWHHASDLPDGGSNFATKLAIWDWLFGTAFLPSGSRPSGYGLVGVPGYPDGYLGQVLFAFRRRPREEAGRAEDRCTT